MKIVVTSDWHLDASTDGLSRFDDVLEAVNTSVDIAIQEQAGLYIMLGDLCDPSSVFSIRAMAEAVRVAGALSDAGIPSVWVAGNHDVMDDGMGTTTLTPLARSMLADHVFESPGEVVIENLHLVGLPFTAPSHAYDPAKVIRDFSKTRRGETTLVLGHLNIATAEGGSESGEMARGREVLWPTEALKKKWPGATLLGGHYHKAGEAEGIHIVGSLARLRHDEEAHSPSITVMEVR